MLGYKLFATGLLLAVAVNGSERLNAEMLDKSMMEYVDARIAEFAVIPSERKVQLEILSDAVQTALLKNESAQLTFICTHNSRRSHLAQIWATTAAEYYRISSVQFFSGGTEATAFNLRAIESLRRAGFQVHTTEQSANPHYVVQNEHFRIKVESFSKVYSDLPNPKSKFFAVMTCSQADRECPVVFGATKRIAIPYDDPKAFDGTPEEEAKYDERCQQIAREMFFVFSKVRQ